MADGLNRCEFIGNLGTEVELRYTASGSAVATFRMAVGRTFTVDGQRKEETEWVSVVCWQKLAELVAQHLEKGRKVYVEGRQQTRSWDDKDGKKRYMTELVANQVLFLDKAPTEGRTVYPDDMDPDDDVPFEP